MSFRRSITLLPLLALFIGAGEVAAQTGTVTGQVTDASNMRPLAGAQVEIVGTNIGAISNAEGRYLIPRVPAGEQTVRVVIIGFGQATQTINLQPGGSAVVDFSLNTSAIQLEGLIASAVTGREQRARELGTNVGNIEVGEMNPAPLTTVSDVLSGRTAGVILQDVNGTTGSSQRIRIRGANSLSLSNEPLVYVDGVLYSADSGSSIGVGGQERSNLNDLNPADIESIEVVKGPAAAALYGTAAANGVLLITTKKGRAGDAQWNFYAEYGELEDITDYPGNWMAYQVVGNGSAPFFTSTGAFNSTDYARCPNRSAAAGNCTQDGVTFFNGLEDPRTTPFSTGFRRRYGTSVRGGNERVTFFVSGEFQDERGVIDYNTMEKTSVRANLNAAVTDNFDLSVTAGYTRNNLDLNSNDNSIFSPILNSLLSEAYFIPNSTKSEFEGPGVARRNYGFGFNQADNRLFVLNDDVDRMTLGGTAQWRPLQWLTLNANGGLDLLARHTFRTVQPGDLPIAATWVIGFRDSDRTNDYTYTFNSSAVGTFQPFNDVVSTTTAGMSFNRELLERTECTGRGLLPGTASCGTTSSLFAVDEDFVEVKTIGFYGSTELAWRDKVFVAGALRGDDNSAFGTDFGFVFYPSAQVSWVIGEENWFPQMNWLSSLRVRGAWGQSGLRPDFRDAVTLFAPVTVTRGGGDVPGVTVNDNDASTGNLELEPETSTEIELGLDAALFDNRLGLDVTWYKKNSKDALISRRLPPSFGLTASRFENLGEVRNKGWEITANITALQMEDVGLDFRAAVTTLDNEVLDIGEGVEDIVFNRGLQRHTEGFTAGGFWQQEVTWNDADGNGLLDNSEVFTSEDPVFIGPSLPTWQYSLTTDLRLFDWINVSTLFEARGGHYTGNDSEAFRCGFRSTRGCSAVGNPDATLFEQARYIADRFGGADGNGSSAFGFVEEADFLKWRELTVTLSPPSALLEAAPQLDGLTFTLSGRNLATWTDYTGLDPETVEGGGNVNFSNSEFNTQPPVRYLMFRLNYSF